MSYGQYLLKTEMYSNGLWANSYDNNLVVCGSFPNTAPYFNEDDPNTLDGFVMRLSDTGNVEWYT